MCTTSYAIVNILRSKYNAYNGSFCFNLFSGGRRLKNFEGDSDEKFWVKGGYPSKTHKFLPICLLPMDNFAIFLDFSFLFFISLYFSSSSEF